MTDLRQSLLDLPPEELERIRLQLQGMGPVVTFPWHIQQEKILKSATNVVIALGGNQSGKTTVGRGAVSRLVNREGPIYRRLRKPKRPLKIWVSPQTLEKFKSNWERQLIKEVFSHLPQERWRYVSAPIPVFRWIDEHTTWAHPNELWGKSHDQGFLAFESDVVDFIVFDEEPIDRRLYSSAVQRLATTNGIIMFTFTPLNGLSWTYSEFYVPLVKGKNRMRYVQDDRHWKKGNAVSIIQMGMADNPEAIAGGGVARIQADPGMSDAEKRTRLYGEYGYTEGMIWEKLAGISVEDEDSPYLLDYLPGDRHYSWFMLADPNKRHGALLTAIDHDGNNYVVDEHYAEGWPDRRHADEYRAITGKRKLDLNKQVEVFADPGGAGAQALINLADLGIHAGPVPKGQGSVKASIELVRRALSIDKHHRHPITNELGAPRLYFLRSLRSTWKDQGVEYNESRLLWEARQYRQKEGAPPDTPIKEKDDVVDPLRYHFLVRGLEPEPPEDEADRLVRETRAKLDRTSLRATQEFDQLAEDIKSGRRKRRYDETLGAIL